MSTRSPIDRIAFGPVAAVRPWMFGKALYLLLAFDVWNTLVGPAWRYGAAGFNVPHFAILSALPIPTREAYIGMLVLVGAMSFAAALLPRAPRALAIAIAALYTWGWSCSMLDSYQHHYLLTVLLVATAAFPRLTSVDLFGDAPATRAAPAPAASKPKGKQKARLAPAAEVASSFPHGLVARVRSLGWTLATCFAGIVYAFTAVSKAEPDWRSGDALRNITQNGHSMPDVMSLAEGFGVEPDTLFHWMGLGTIAIQIVCSLGYLTASLRDGESTADERAAYDRAWSALQADQTRIVIALAVSAMAAAAIGVGFSWGAAACAFLFGVGVGTPAAFHRFLFRPYGRVQPLSVLASLALVLALQFHVGAEYIGLQIGWFSYYMIALALIALAPAHWLAALAALVTSPWRTREPGLFDRVPLLAPALGLLGASAAAFAGTDIDLPGAYPAAMLVGVVALGLGLATLARREIRSELGRGTLALGLAMVCCWASMTHGAGNERYDFYRFAGGDFRRRHAYRAALEAYRAANRYAPEGESREDRVREMEAAIRAEGGTP